MLEGTQTMNHACRSADASGSGPCPTVRQVDVSGRQAKRGKVRDLFDLGDELLLVATDRISAFDCVLPDPIPRKGAVLTALSGFWFDRLAGQYPHHLIEIVRQDVPEGFESVAELIRGRAMRCRKADVIPIECVARGYLAGSGWAEYQASGTVCGIRLPTGLRQCSRLPSPIFTPATKAESGHDENISFETACDAVGRDVMTSLRDMTLAIYQHAAEYLQSRGIIIADTKFEFGRTADGLILIDEVLTPDSSRFWPADKYAEGRDQESFDKQFVRNYLESINFNKSGPGVELPEDIRSKTADKYIEGYERLTGKKFEPPTR